MRRLFANARSQDQTVRAQALLTICSLMSLVLNFGSSIILSRIYDPAVFGVFAIWMSINTLCLVPSMLRLELAVQIPKAQSDAFEVAGLAALIAGGAVLLQALLIFGIQDWLLMYFGVSVKPFLILSPLLLLTSSWIALANQIAIRMQLIKWIAVALFSQTVISITLKFALMPLGGVTNPLILAELISQVCVLGLLINRLPLLRMLREQASTVKSVLRQMRGYWQFPREALPASFVESFNVQLPIILLTPAFGEATVGHFARAVQLLSLPSSVLATPISTIYQAKGAEAFRETGSCRSELKSSLRKLFIYAIVIFPLSALVMPWALGFLFGPKWVPAGELGQIVAIYSFFGFICGPISATLFFTRRTGLNLAWIILTLASNWFFLAWGVSTGDVKTALIHWALSYAVMYLIVLALSYYAAKGTELKRTPAT